MAPVEAAQSGSAVGREIWMKKKVTTNEVSK